MKPKIALFVPSLTGGGAERVMVTIANNLALRAYPTQLVIAKPDLTYAKELSPEVQLINLNTYRMTRTILPLARYFRAERPAAILSTLAEANIAAILARMIAGFPCRLVVREASTPSQQLLQHPHRKKRLTGKILRQMYLRAGAIVAVSNGVYRDLVEGMQLPVSKVHLIRNPVPLKEIHQKMRQSVEHPWFTEGAPPVILSVGRLESVKDYPSLIHAFARARESIEARLVILGEGSERHALQQLIQSLGLEGSVDLPGFDPNPFRYMGRARLYVLSSRYEGFPNALVQALACGCPIVSTDCESGPRDILNDGQYGLLVPVGDVEKMAQAIVQAIRQPPPPAPREWIEQFDAEHVIEQLIDVLIPNLQFLRDDTESPCPADGQR